MPCVMATRIGDGKPALVLEEVRRKWPGLEVTFRSDDISRPTDWRIRDRRHAVVVHLGGHMHRLETELDGFGGSTGPASPGEVWTVPAERKYASHACGTSIQYALMLLEPDALDHVAGTRHGRCDLASLAGASDEFLHHAVRKLMTIAKARDDVSEMLGRSLSRTICLHLGRTYAPGATLPPSGSNSGPTLDVKSTRQLREFIFDNLCERITLDDLAGLTGMTVHQLLIAFRKAFGCTPAQYVIRQRLRHARRQLVGTKKDITTIAMECGFSSHSHLTSTFTKHVGCPPCAFRRSAS